MKSRNLFETMMMNLNVFITILFFVDVITANTPECNGLPTNSDLTTTLITWLDDHGESNPIVLNVMYTCQAQGMIMGSYRGLAGILSYSSANVSEPIAKQFDIECIEGIGFTGWVVVDSSFRDAPSDYVSLETRTDCSQCQQAAKNDHDCVGKNHCVLSHFNYCGIFQL